MPSRSPCRPRCITRSPRDLIDAGIHVLIEKPICDTPEAARDLIARAEARGVVLQIGHIERFSPVFGAVARAR